MIYPIGAVVQASNGKMYGVTKAGGGGNQGTLFVIDPATNVYNKLYDFVPGFGYTPANS